MDARTWHKHVMNFSIHLDETTAKKLARQVGRGTRTRNAVVTQAVKEWLERAEHQEWPRELLDFAGAPKMAPFENGRSRQKIRSRFP